jgi:hypothetical protein
MKKWFVNMELMLDRAGRLIECVEKRDELTVEGMKRPSTTAGQGDAEK